MNTTRTTLAAALASLALFAAAPSHAAGTDLQASVQAAVSRIAPDVTVELRGNVVELRGWAADPSVVLQASYAAKQVPGVQQAYAQGVRVWSSDVGDDE